MPDILLVGCGNIGRWHLKGLDDSDFDLNVIIVETNETAQHELTRFIESHLNKIVSISVIDSLENLPIQQPNFDLTIVSTTAHSRCELVRGIMQRVKTDYWILEKPIEQSVERILELQRAMSGEKIWVNHPRRLMPIYRRLKEILQGQPDLKFVCKGKRIGLACNASHFIDLACWITGSEPLEVDLQELENEWYQTQRSGFWDIDGKLKFKLSDNFALEITSSRLIDGLNVEVWKNETLLCTVDEKLEQIKLSDGEIINAAFLPQSQLTGTLFDTLLKTGGCGLSTLNETVNYNSKFTEHLLRHWQKKSGKLSSIMPIT